MCGCTVMVESEDVEDDLNDGEEVDAAAADVEMLVVLLGRWITGDEEAGEAEAAPPDERRDGGGEVTLAGTEVRPEGFEFARETAGELCAEIDGEF